jgi:hypothetical protein
MKKKPSLSKTLKRTWDIFSKYIRLRDCLKTTGNPATGKCYTCGRLCEYVNCDAGHFVSRRFKSTLFDERNVNLQCKSCNGFPGAATYREYEKHLIKDYGEGIVIELEGLAQEIKKWTIPDLKELQDQLNEKIKALED